MNTWRLLSLMCCQTFLMTSVREASETPRNAPREGETGNGFRMPVGGRVAAGPVFWAEAAAAEVLAAAMRTLQPFAKPMVDEAILSQRAKTLEERV
ncbi:hypothetical protein RHGRI_031240 [Rhododendron griersonianum]|uniref:Uncharacterized protein n=1 Tax=Rhododendron griersonianum TaxID=479676 RepID=A0AAV6I7L7_9ERIC|nr:hypothetical protein RHGRI_031240 [Rhododendron griersonianum]